MMYLVETFISNITLKDIAPFIQNGVIFVFGLFFISIGKKENWFNSSIVQTFSESYNKLNENSEYFIFKFDSTFNDTIIKEKISSLEKDYETLRTKIEELKKSIEQLKNDKNLSILSFALFLLGNYLLFFSSFKNNYYLILFINTFICIYSCYILYLYFCLIFETKNESSVLNIQEIVKTPVLYSLSIILVSLFFSFLIDIFSLINKETLYFFHSIYCLISCFLIIYIFPTLVLIYKRKQEEIKKLLKETEEILTNIANMKKILEKEINKISTEMIEKNMNPSKEQNTNKL